MNAIFVRLPACRPVEHERRSWQVRVFALLALCLPGTSALAFPSCPANIDRSTPDSDFVDNGDATITHVPTGLTWKQCSEGLSGTNCLTGVASPLTFAGAQAAAAAANTGNFAGHNDWRVPSYTELQSLVETGCQSASINWTLFPATIAGEYWSSTSYQFAPVAAWGVRFDYGTSVINAKTATYAVRLVRGGKSFTSFDSTTDGATSATGPSPTGSGTISAGFTGGGAGCGFAYSQFVLPDAPLPPGVTLPHGLFDFSVYNCTTASSLAVTITYPATLPAGTVFWKYGPTAGNTAPHWYILPASISGNQVHYTITDGQVGDDDLVVNGHITDPGGAGTDRIFGNGFE